MVTAFVECAPTGSVSLASGQSPESAYLNERFSREWTRMVSVESVSSNSLLSELQDLYDEVCTQDWDGHDALPVSYTAYEKARDFIELLPLGGELPELGAEPDGYLTFEWHKSPRMTLSISVGDDSRCHYSALIGENVIHGSSPFRDYIEGDILKLVRAVTDA